MIDRDAKVCRHEDFGATVEVARIVPDQPGPMAFSASIRIVCSRCLVPFEFLGLAAGMSPIEPMTSVDRLELRAPIVPLGEKANPNLPGFRVNVIDNRNRGPVQ